MIREKGDIQIMCSSAEIVDLKYLIVKNHIEDSQESGAAVWTVGSIL